ncbi:MAG: rod shape-determining protein MreC [bacterium]
MYQIYKSEVLGIWKSWIVVTVLFFLLDSIGWMGWFRRSVIWIMNPAKNASGYLMSNIDRTLRYTQQVHQAARQNLDLKRQVAELIVSADEAKILIGENQKLRKMLALQPKITNANVMGKVVLGDRSQWRVWFENVVLLGSMVTDENRLVGIVTRVEGRVAIVSPVGTGKLAQVAVRKIDGKQPLGNVIMTGNELAIQKISKEIDVGVGELLVTVGDGLGIDPDLPVASISDVITLPESVYQTLKLKSEVQLEIGEIVFAIGEHK